MHKKLVFTVLIAILWSMTAQTQQTFPDDVLLLNRDVLAQARRAYRSDPSHVPPAVRTLLGEAEQALAAGLVSVVQKQQLPPSGSPHDYMSLGPYWWPDPTKPNGLPYIRRDGEVNPEYRTVGDNERIGRMVDNVQTLALAYAVTGEERYAQRAVMQVTRWFLDDSTRMNPHLEYAQAIKGVNQGRGIGIIETYSFRYLVDAMILLRHSRHWTPEIHGRITGWFTAYLTWLQESPNGRDEAGWKNNHGSAYDVQTSCIALFLGKTEVARRILGEVGTKRIAVQVEPDGSQPLELERTKSWDYSVMNLDALTELAILGSRVDVDLWEYRTSDGRGIRRALEFLLPYAEGKKAWTWTQIFVLKPERLHRALRLAGNRLHEPSFLESARALASDSLRSSREMLFLPSMN